MRPPAPARIAATPAASSQPFWNPAVPPPPVDGGAVGNGVGDAVGDGLGDAVGDGLGETVGEGDGDVVGLGDGLGDGLRLEVGLAVGVASPLGVLTPGTAPAVLVGVDTTLFPGEG
jgi:hypothetical protein